MANRDWKMDIIKSTILHVLELALILDEISSCKRSVSDYFQSVLCGSDPEQLYEKNIYILKTFSRAEI